MLNNKVLQHVEYHIQYHTLDEYYMAGNIGKELNFWHFSILAQDCQILNQIYFMM